MLRGNPAADAFTRAFGTGAEDEASPEGAAGRPRPADATLSWTVFGPGPLVVEYTWGEPIQQLHQRTDAVAVRRLADMDLAPWSHGDQKQRDDHHHHHQQQQQQQQQQQPPTTSEQQPVHVAPDASTVAKQKHATQSHQLREQFSSGYDVVVGADLVYDPTSHAALLDALGSTCLSHTQVRKGLTKQCVVAAVVCCYVISCLLQWLHSWQGTGTR